MFNHIYQRNANETKIVFLTYEIADETTVLTEPFLCVSHCFSFFTFKSYHHSYVYKNFLSCTFNIHALYVCYTFINKLFCLETVCLTVYWKGNHYCALVGLTLCSLPDAEVRDDGSHWENSSVPAEVDEMFSSDLWGSVSSMALWQLEIAKFGVVVSATKISFWMNLPSVLITL